MELFVVINFFLTIYLFFQISSLKDRLKNTSSNVQTQVAMTPPLTQAASTVSSQSQASVLLDTKSDDSITRAIMWLREDWMLKLGGFFILLALGWFVTYAFMNNWIGETGRIVLGILLGSGFMAWGAIRMNRIMRQGEIILMTGAVILVTSVFAGQHAYNLYPDAISLPVMVFVAVVISIISYFHKRETLAIMSVIMIGISPILAGYRNTNPNVTGLFIYLLCMSSGVLWLARVTGWKSIIFMSTLVVSFYIIPYFAQYQMYTESTQARVMYQYGSDRYYGTTPKMAVDVDVLRFFAIVFSILFNLSAFFALLFEKKSSKMDYPLLASGALFVATALFMMSSPDTLALKLALVAVLYMALALILVKMTRYSYFVELYATVSILFLVVATLKTSGSDLLPIALSVEAMVLTVFYRYAFGKPYPLVSVVPYAGAILTGLSSMFDFGATPQATASFVFVLMSTYFPYAFSKVDTEKENAQKYRTISSISLIVGNLLASVGFYSLLENVGRSLMLVRSLVNGVRYTAYAVVGSFLYFMSRGTQSKVKYFFGLGFIVYVVASLLLFEVWTLDIAARIVVFFLIGLLFISSIYFLKMYEKKK